MRPAKRRPESRPKSHQIIAEPATIERWDDLVSVFGRPGAYGGCWCMYWRIKRTEMGRLRVKGRRSALKDLTRRERPPGILYYDTSGAKVRFHSGGAHWGRVRTSPYCNGPRC